MAAKMRESIRQSSQQPRLQECQKHKFGVQDKVFDDKEFIQAIGQESKNLGQRNDRNTILVSRLMFLRVRNHSQPFATMLNKQEVSKSKMAAKMRGSIRQSSQQNRLQDCQEYKFGVQDVGFEECIQATLNLKSLIQVYIGSGVGYRIKSYLGNGLKTW